MPEPSYRRVPTRCAMIHPYVDVAALELLKARAEGLGYAPEQLASLIIESVMANPRAQRLINI